MLQSELTNVRTIINCTDSGDYNMWTLDTTYRKLYSYAVNHVWCVCPSQHVKNRTPRYLIVDIRFMLCAPMTRMGIPTA
jgi:hypothetical protein